jgi:pyroglutamyl-peptidase
MRILLTGFEPFGDVKINPSQCVVEHFAAQGRDDLITLVLPTVYSESGARIRDAIKQHNPDAVLSLGVAASRDAINLERIAVNVDDARIPDNAGVLASGEPIDTDGPVGYRSTLPLAAMKAALEARGIAVTISNHAGAYMCNHVFYSARHALEQAGSTIPCGFIHIPDLAQPDGTTNAHGKAGMPLDTLIEAVEICLQVLCEAEPTLEREVARSSPE